MLILLIIAWIGLVLSWIGLGFAWYFRHQLRKQLLSLDQKYNYLKLKLQLLWEPFPQSPSRARETSEGW